MVRTVRVPLQACAATSRPIRTQHRGEPDSLTVADSLCSRKQAEDAGNDCQPDLKEQPVPTDSLQRPSTPKVMELPVPTKPPGLPSSFPAVDRLQPQIIGNCPSSMEVAGLLPMPHVEQQDVQKDYSAAYKDAVNGNFNSSTITDLPPPAITTGPMTEHCRKRKDTFRRYRDRASSPLSVYTCLSVVDAYVDAELSTSTSPRPQHESGTCHNQQPDDWFL